MGASSLCRRDTSLWTAPAARADEYSPPAFALSWHRDNPRPGFSALSRSLPSLPTRLSATVDPPELPACRTRHRCLRADAPGCYRPTRHPGGADSRDLSDPGRAALAPLYNRGG